MSVDLKDLLIEQAASAYRTRDSHGHIQPAPAWWDLAPADRDALFQRQLESRLIERAVDPLGHTSTIRSVLARIPE